MSRRKKGSKRYLKAQKKYWKWLNRKNNKKKDAYHKFTYNIVKNYDIICMEDLNIEGMMKNGKWAPKLQRITWGQMVKGSNQKATALLTQLKNENKIVNVKEGKKSFYKVA